MSILPWTGFQITEHCISVGMWTVKEMNWNLTLLLYFRNTKLMILINGKKVKVVPRFYFHCVSEINAFSHLERKQKQGRFERHRNLFGHVVGVFFRSVGGVLRELKWLKLSWLTLRQHQHTVTHSWPFSLHRSRCRSRRSIIFTMSLQWAQSTLTPGPVKGHSSV